MNGGDREPLLILNDDLSGREFEREEQSISQLRLLCPYSERDAAKRHKSKDLSKVPLSRSFGPPRQPLIAAVPTPMIHGSMLPACLW
jgi:hypothetical protein